MKLNENYANLKDSYLFSAIAKKVAAYKGDHPDADVISLGIGDVTLPLCDAVTAAMHHAVDELSEKATFRGYAPDGGYDFLREAIRVYYSRRGVVLDAEEIFVSDGAKSDVGNIVDIFSRDNTVLVTDPVYPVYVDTNIMDGRTILYARGGEENGFLPMPDPAVHADMIYLCSPNNPTGAVYTHAQLAEWVAYARANDAVLLFDAAYEAFISDPALPRSIFEVEGARECAIEFCSLSKTAGFTGTRCGYTVIPRELIRAGVSLGALWGRRQGTKFNGTAYVIQRAAAAVFTPEGQRQTAAAIGYYMKNAAVIAAGLDRCGVRYTGGKNSPYLWLRCPGGMKSWDFFDRLLTEGQVVGTPGAGFGACGEGWFRLTAFGDRDRTLEAVRRLTALLGRIMAEEKK